MPDESIDMIFSATKCPNCGGNKFLVESTFKEETDKRNIDISDMPSPRPGLTPQPLIQVYSFPDDIGIKLGVGGGVIVTSVVLDACTECGTIVAKEIFKGKGKLTNAQPKQQPGQKRNMPPDTFGPIGS